MDTVKLTIDGQQVTVEKGKTVLQAAIESGITVPYYCYHPGHRHRRVVPRLHRQDREDAEAADVVLDAVHRRHGRHHATPDVVAARAGVFEFLLINHPLDCPVCDKGGECPLQDFSYTFGPAESRMDFPRRVFDGEGVKADVDFGPTLMLNRNRCILCTRCVRFMREVDDDAQISIADRGNGSEIATFQEEGVHSLLSGNLMDVCPVGAITTRDYRFKSRPWDNPDAVDTICTLCSKGLQHDARGSRRSPSGPRAHGSSGMTPRFNPDVNGYWMCDIGRFDYHWIEGDERLQRPLLRDGAGALAARRTGTDALSKLADRVTAAGGPAALRFLVSAHASLEELFSSDGWAARSGCPKPAWRSAGATARNRSRRTPSSRFRPSMRRT